MQNLFLDNFNEEIIQLREYIKHIGYVNDLISDNVPVEILQNEPSNPLNTIREHDKNFAVERRIFEYKAIVITLYGLLEKYIEIWIKDYLDFISNITIKYNELDEKVKQNHFDLSLKLISLITVRESVKFQHVNKETIIKNLYNCVENIDGYKFNTDAFVVSSGNLKHVKIVELFSALNLSMNAALISNKNLLEHIQEVIQAKNVSGLSTDVLYFTVNDLVMRRNKIAHGSEIIDDILSIPFLKGYIDFISHYCNAIFEMLNEEVIKCQLKYLYVKIDNILAVNNRSILSFSIENKEIKIDDVFIIITADNKHFRRKVLEIQIDGISYPSVKINELSNVAVRLEPTIKLNQSFFIAK